jgi:hypothetical protein
MWSLKANRLSCALLIAPSGVRQVIGLSPAERPVVQPVPDDDIERVSAPVRIMMHSWIIQVPSSGHDRAASI